MRNAPDRNAMIPPHLNETQILAYQDGELTRAEMEQARAHLESCWTCRSRLGAVQSSIDHFLEARNQLLPPPSAFSDSRVEQFRQRLMRHASETSNPSASLAQRIAESFRSWRVGLRKAGSLIAEHRQAAIASVLMTCMLVLMFTDVLNTRVSADTLLARADSFEASHRPGAGQVNRISIRVERIDRGTAAKLGSIVVLQDSATPLVFVRAESPVGSVEGLVKDPNQISGRLLSTLLSGDPQDSSLATYLTTQGWSPDVSAAEFRRLISGRGDTKGSVHHTNDGYEADYPFATGHASGIAEARFLVNAQDYSPISLSIITSSAQAGREYRFTRTEFTSEPRSVELARFASAPVVGHSVSGSPESTSSIRKIVPLSYTGSHASEAEVAVAIALHRVDACLGEEVNIFPMSDGSLLVQGLVDTAARRDAIRQALRSATGPLRVEVYLPRELKSGSELYGPPDQMLASSAFAGGSRSATLADLSSSNMPLHDLLYDHFSKTAASSDDSEKQIAVFSNEVVTLARQAFLHAWALKRLDREFPAERTSGLSAAGLQEIEQMRQDHRRWISTLAHHQADLLSEVADANLLAGAFAVTSGPQDSDTLLQLSREQSDLVRSLFTASSQSPETTTSLTRLLSVLKRMGA